MFAKEVCGSMPWKPLCLAGAPVPICKIYTMRNRPPGTRWLWVRGFLTDCEDHTLTFRKKLSEKLECWESFAVKTRREMQNCSVSHVVVVKEKEKQQWQRMNGTGGRAWIMGIVRSYIILWMYVECERLLYVVGNFSWIKSASWQYRIWLVESSPVMLGHINILVSQNLPFAHVTLLSFAYLSRHILCE